MGRVWKWRSEIRNARKLHAPKIEGSEAEQCVLYYVIVGWCMHIGMRQRDRIQLFCTKTMENCLCSLWLCLSVCFSLPLLPPLCVSSSSSFCPCFFALSLRTNILTVLMYTLVLVYLKYMCMCSISRISPSWAGCKKTLCLLHSSRKIKFIHSFCLSVCRSLPACLPACLSVSVSVSLSLSLSLSLNSWHGVLILSLYFVLDCLPEGWM